MRSFALLSAFTLLSGCVVVNTDKGDTDDDGTSGDTGGLTDTAGDTGDTAEEEVYTLDGTVTGAIKLQLYDEDATGEAVMIDWLDAFDAYPYGKVFVTAYATSEDGERTSYFAEDALTPSADGTVGTYALTVKEKEAHELYVYAVVDWLGEGIIGTNDPVGYYNDAIVVQNGDTFTNADVTVMIKYYRSGGGSCPDDGMAVSGLLTVATEWADGNVQAMLFDSNGEGPWNYSGALTPSVIAGGAEANYSMYQCDNYGANKLLGAWDSNGNELIDPLDKWGSYLSDVDVDGNPITLGADDLTGLGIQVPFGDVGPSIVPFITIGGTVTLLDDLSSPPAGAKTYVGAFKRKPTDTIAVADLEDLTYDYAEYDATQMAAGSFTYANKVPANSVAFAWAFVDIDGDGILREDGEPLGASAGSSGKVATGNKSQTDLHIQLGYPGGGG